jgi:hypothetical protein
MATPFDAKWEDCKQLGQRFFAEFTWDGKNDGFAEGRFKEWDENLFGTDDNPMWPTIRRKNTQAYYLVGTRTFWIISCSKDEDEIRAFCNHITRTSKIKYSYYQCLKPGEPGAPKKLKPE